MLQPLFSTGSVCAQAEQWHLKKISKPHLEHGTYSIFFWDGDVGGG